MNDIHYNGNAGTVKIVNRYTDKTTAQSPATLINTPLPAINWESIGQSAPEKIPIGQRSDSDPLPYADYVIITWTSAEWKALDHVFLNSTSPSTDSYSWRYDWHQYSADASDYTADAKSGQLWGQFQLVQITDQSKRPWRVLLFKSNSHLAHSPWIDGLSAMMRCIIRDTKAGVIYTIGTAGGARLNQSLGDAVVTNSAVIQLQRPENAKDPSNGNSFRCPTWYPGTSLLQTTEENLLFKLSEVANDQSLLSLFAQLKAKHPGDPKVEALQLEDLLNEGLNPNLNNPKIQSLKDVPLLTTDFYYIANGDSADAFAFLEMDDAIIARECNALGVRFACIRNISDPIVPYQTKAGVTISDGVRGDWSGLVYTNFGLYTSFNGALATWATIAGEGSPVYNPQRFITSPDESDPMEIQLVYKVRSCGTCKFFWPDNKADAGYGPYTAFDFDVNTPYESAPANGSDNTPWFMGRTRPPSFPNGEISDGCRKAPIMTIGINPNLTAFSLGQIGAAWAYPNFSSNDNTNEWAKYASYYRYRSIYQEKLSLDFVKKFLLSDGQIVAQRDGKITQAVRSDSYDSWQLHVRYQGYAEDTIITVPGSPGDFPYMLLFDTMDPNNTFVAGDILVGKIAVPEGIQVEIEQKQQGYYMQFLPTLKQFEEYLIEKGHTDAHLEIGEDVSQLDMVACASPHWTEGYLGNEMKTIVNNCVSKNAWAVKQFVQTNPSVLYIVSESSWNMFKGVLGNFVDKGKISDHPADQSYTLLRETTMLNNPVYIRFDFEIDGIPFKSKTRLVITPHFSFNTNFLPQYRMSPEDFTEISALPDFSTAITVENGFTILPADQQHPYYYREIQLQTDTAAQSRAFLQSNYSDLYNRLEPYYYDSHELMSAVLKKMYEEGELNYDDSNNYLQRTSGACKFCVNQYWQFPLGCKYGKPAEKSPPADFLEKVADYIIKNGNPYNVPNPQNQLS